VSAPLVEAYHEGANNGYAMSDKLAFSLLQNRAKVNDESRHVTTFTVINCRTGATFSAKKKLETRFIQTLTF